MATFPLSPSAVHQRTPATVRRRKRAETAGGTTASGRRPPFTYLSFAVSFGVLCSCARPAVAYSISVAKPLTVAAGAELTLEWTLSTGDDDVSGTSGDLYPFEIELRSCSADASQCENYGCGNYTFRSLCERADGCMDSDGSYDVTIPSDASAGDYSIRVSYMGPYASSGDAGEASGCTGSFAVTAPDIPLGTPVIAARAPDIDLTPGQAFTAEWDYDDGQGHSDGNFGIDLYSCIDGGCASGSCGVFTTALCGVEGCFDPGTGDYDVRIPADTSPGSFKLQVKESESNVSSCTNATFEIVADQGPAPVATFPPTPSPLLSSSSSASSQATSAPVATSSASSGTDNPAPSPSISSSSSSSSAHTPGVPPTPVPERIECNSTAVLSYTYSEEDTGLPLVTIEHANGDRDQNGCATLTTLWEWLQTGPPGVPTDLLHPVDRVTNTSLTTADASPTGKWLLRTSVDVSNGVMLEIKGTDTTGGDSDEVLLSSSSDRFFRLRGYGGHLYMLRTKIEGWDEAIGAAHDLPAGTNGTEPRSYLSCVSEILEDGQLCEGRAQKAKGECRMDVLESEIAYLGYQETESYGLTWKVRGLCKDLSNVDTLFESVRVYGDIQDSDVHNLWYGHYSYGHLGGVWTNNLMHDNHVYGFDPHDDSDFLTIEGNTCYNNGDHGIIASKRCDHLSVKNNVAYNNGGSGIMLHRSCDYSIVEGNDLYDNVDAGLSIVETAHTYVVDNKLIGNKWGMRIVLGATDNLVEDNTFDSNAVNDIHLYMGPDEPMREPYTGVNEGNIINENRLTVTAKITVDVEDSFETTITNNVFTGNTGKFSFVRSNSSRVTGNTGTAASADPTIESSCFTTDSGLLPVC